MLVKPCFSGPHPGAQKWGLECDQGLKGPGAGDSLCLPHGLGSESTCPGGAGRAAAMCWAPEGLCPALGQSGTPLCSTVGRGLNRLPWPPLAEKCWLPAEMDH